MRAAQAMLHVKVEDQDRRQGLIRTEVHLPLQVPRYGVSSALHVLPNINHHYSMESPFYTLAKIT